MTDTTSWLPSGVIGSPLEHALNQRVRGALAARSILRWSGWPYVVILFAALNVVTWFPSAQPIGWRDSGFLTFSYHPALLAHVDSYPWNPLDQLGVPNASGMAALPFALWFWVASILGVTSGVAQAVLYYLLQVERDVPHVSPSLAPS